MKVKVIGQKVKVIIKKTVIIINCQGFYAMYLAWDLGLTRVKVTGQGQWLQGSRSNNGSNTSTSSCFIPFSHSWTLIQCD